MIFSDLLVMVVFACFLTSIGLFKYRVLSVLSGFMWVSISLKLVEINEGFFFISLAFGLILVYMGIEGQLQAASE